MHEKTARKATRLAHTVLWVIALFLVAVENIPAELATTQVRIGVLAFRGADIAKQMWQPTVTYLNQEIAQHNFTLVPLTIKEMEAAIASDDIDFVLTNPGNYVALEARYGITRLLTLRNLRHGQPYTVFGAVIFTRADRRDIHDLTDLRGKSFGAVAKSAFGGFQMAWMAFKKVNIDPFSDFSELRFLGFPQDNIVSSVRDGLLDAGTVRTDTLERMAAQGLIQLEDFTVLGQRQTPGFPFLHSTELYPEWPFSKTHNTSSMLAKQVAIALLRLPPESAAAKAGKNAGWTVPLNYQTVHNLFKVLEIEPYQHKPNMTLSGILKQYWYISVLLGTIIAFGAFHIIRVDRLVITRTRALTNTNKALEHEIIERKKQQAEMQRTTLQLQQREAEIQRHRDHLEELVEQRTHELMAVNKELEAYSYSIAHDLRTPLRSLTSFSQILMGDGAEQLNDEQRDSLQRIIKASKHMAHLIDDILELARITRMELCTEQVNMSDIAGEIMELLQNSAPKRRVSLSISDQLIVKGDRQLLRVALENLLGNAWKYTNRVTHASIEFGANRQQEKTVYFIRDNGIGFDMRYLDKLFIAFQRLHSSAEYEGTGIGLATVQRAVHRHGGEVWAQGEPGKGASFHFTLG